jgi:cell division protein FtsZ
METGLNNFKYEIEEESRRGTRIKVIGVGGGGCNAVARMVAEGLEGVEFYAMNTDRQSLSACQVSNKLQLGERITNGLGVGSNPELGRQAALENTDAMVELLQGADMVFVTAGMGGGTGTGAAPVVASLAKELDALTVAVVTKPFTFEGPKRMRVAEEGLERLAGTVDAMISIPNDRLLALAPPGATFCEGLKLADDLLRQAVQGITDIMVTPGLINRDFSDIKATMSGMGHAMMGTAIGRGEKAAVEAARQAISCPLLEDTRIAGSRCILINVTGSSRLGLHEINEACSIIREAADCDDVQINFGVILNESMADAVKITVIATGFTPQAVSRPDRHMAFAATPGPAPVRVEPRLPEPEPIPAAVPEPPAPVVYLEPEPAPSLIADASPVLDLEDLDMPAYLTQGRLLN